MYLMGFYRFDFVRESEMVQMDRVKDLVEKLKNEPGIV